MSTKRERELMSALLDEWSAFVGDAETDEDGHDDIVLVWQRISALAEAMGYVFVCYPATSGG